MNFSTSHLQSIDALFNASVYALAQESTIQDDARAIGDQPEDPDCQAQAMKIFQLLLPVTEQDNGCPERVRCHKQESNRPGQAVQAEIKLSTCKQMHHLRPDSVEEQPTPEEEQVPRLEVSGKMFTPYPDGIEDQSNGHRNDGKR
jgi:hypothetical protein